jgi:hypothetical protein
VVDPGGDNARHQKAEAVAELDQQEEGPSLSVAQALLAFEERQKWGEYHAGGEIQGEDKDKE